MNHINLFLRRCVYNTGR